MCSQSVASNYEAPEPRQRYLLLLFAAKVLLRLGKCAAVDESLSALPSDENSRLPGEAVSRPG